MTPSDHPAINLVARHPIDPGWLDEELTALEGLVETGDEQALLGALRRMVTEPRRAPVAVEPVHVGAPAVDPDPDPFGRGLRV